MDPTDRSRETGTATQLEQHPEREGAPAEEASASPVRLGGRGSRRADRGAKVFREPAPPAVRGAFTPEQRLLMLDTWQRSGLPAAEFGAMVGVTGHTLYQWKQAFDRNGPAGLSDKPRGAPRGSRLPETTQRAIRMLKRAHKEWGCDRIQDVLLRCEGYAASPGAILRVLQEDGYEVVSERTHPHPPRVPRFERARPNQLWQTDLFTFTLKRENRRVHLVVFMDDHSRFLVGHGLHATASGALVREVLEAAIRDYGAPEEVMTDNGTQYHTWRGKSAFTKLLDRRGIRHIVTRPRRPQSLGKCERFWGTLWRECLQEAIFTSMDDARKRIAHFVDYYNFQRTHQGIEGLVPADRFFVAAPEVMATLRLRVAANALDLARHGVARKSFYLTGRVGEAGISLHSEGGRVVLTRSDGEREEVDLEATGRRALPGEETELPAPLARLVDVPETADEDEPIEEEDADTGEPDGENDSELRP